MQNLKHVLCFEKSILKCIWVDGKISVDWSLFLHLPFKTNPADMRNEGKHTEEP